MNLLYGDPSGAQAALSETKIVNLKLKKKAHQLGETKQTEAKLRIYMGTSLTRKRIPSDPTAGLGLGC